MVARTCGSSFEARREERRAPQDDGGVFSAAMNRRYDPAFSKLISLHRHLADHTNEPSS
jgi:hypothetical protein